MIKFYSLPIQVTGKIVGIFSNTLLKLFQKSSEMDSSSAQGRCDSLI